MSRDLSALFREEAAELQQSQVYHLMTMEITTLATAVTIAESNVVSVSSAADFSEGQYVSIDGIDGIRQVVSVDTIVSTIVLNDTVDTSVAEAAVRLHIAIADSNQAVTFDGITYVQFPVKFSEISVSSDGTIDKASLTIANVSREIMYYIERYDGLRNNLVVVKTVFQRFLDYIYTVDLAGEVTTEPNPEADPSAYVEDSFKVDSYSADENAVVLNLDPSTNLNIKLPHRRYTSDSCYWRYREANTCGFDLNAFLLEENIHGTVQADPYYVCTKTYAECAARRNIARFGGFPGIAGQRRVFL